MTMTFIATRSCRPSLSPCSLLSLLLLAHLGAVDCSGSAQFTQVTRTASFPVRWAHFAFAWADAIWVAGGVEASGTQFTTGSADVWGSHDYGRTWYEPTFSNGTVVNLPGVTCQEGSQGIVYNDAVYLVSDCSSMTKGAHGASGTDSNDLWTYVSRDPALTIWTTLQDGCMGCAGFSVERMAVPFDGTGTLILVNDGTTADVWWQSATGNFQSTTPGHGTKNTWTPWKAATHNAVTYAAPWGTRTRSATATDAEGLLLILTGGSGNNDVWQLSWTSSSVAPLVYQVAGSPGWGGRDLHLAVMVHDWLFIYGGAGNGNGYYDDAWMSGDYGVTWTLYDAAATGQSRGHIGGMSLGRRLFITAGVNQHLDGNFLEFFLLHDVYVSYWSVISKTAGEVEAVRNECQGEICGFERES